MGRWVRESVLPQGVVGGRWSSIAAGYQNHVEAELGSVLGGEGTNVQSAATYAAILGGSFNALTDQCTTIPAYQNSC